jgi:hypothetical protein
LKEEEEKEKEERRDFHQPEEAMGENIHNHGLINNIDTKAKCRHLKKLTCKGLLRLVFIREYRLEIQSVKLIFSTQLSELLPL